MNLKKGKIKKFNKKLIVALMAGTIVLTPIAGCGDPSYIEVSDGVYELAANVTFSSLKYYYLIEMNFDNKQEIYIAYKDKLNPFGNETFLNEDPTYCVYHNILDNSVLYTERTDADLKMGKNDYSVTILDESIEDYLIYFNEVKESYTKEDIERIVCKINDYKQNEKQVTKETVKEKIKTKE